MARLRYNGLTATLGAALASGDTTITFAAALTSASGAVPTISGSDYIPLAILSSTGAVSEIVSLTAYTTGATTGTITRAQESTTASAHASGDSVVHSPTVADFAASSSGAAQRMRRTSGDVTVSSTIQAALPGVTSTMDITLTAKAGDVLLVGIDAQFDNGTGTLRPDVYTVVAGALTNSVGGVSNAYGIAGWTRPNGSYQYVSGIAPYVVQAGDVVSGQVTLRLTGKVDSGSRIIGGSAASPLTFSAMNTSA